MKTLIYGAGPIGRWLALRLQKAGKDVTLFVRNRKYRSLQENGIEIVDGLTGERLIARPRLVNRLESDDHYDLVVVAMQKSSSWATMSPDTSAFWTNDRTTGFFSDFPVWVVVGRVTTS
jgi:2-dehydropantoate 2-reductase